MKGELQFHSDRVDVHAHVLSALGIAPDGRSAWFAGTTSGGQSLLVYVEDNGEPGAEDVFRLWLGGVLQTDDGHLSGGNVQIQKGANDSVTVAQPLSISMPPPLLITDCVFSSTTTFVESAP